jgi:hypothetical protein
VLLASLIMSGNDGAGISGSTQPNMESIQRRSAQWDFQPVETYVCGLDCQQTRSSSLTSCVQSTPLFL